MQNGPADQADLADFIARGNKPDLVALLRHAGERLPSGCDTAADHRVVLLHYLRRALECGAHRVSRHMVHYSNSSLGGALKSPGKNGLFCIDFRQSRESNSPP